MEGTIQSSRGRSRASKGGQEEGATWNVLPAPLQSLEGRIGVAHNRSHVSGSVASAGCQTYMVDVHGS